MRKNVSKISKITRLIIIISMITACFLVPVIWIANCAAQYVLPEVTGKPDDGLWFYSGNYRALSNLSNEEKLIPSIEINNEAFDVFPSDYEYSDDNVYMCLEFYYTPTTRGSAFAGYNIKTKTTDFLFIGTDDFSPCSIGVVKDDYCLVFNAQRDKGYIIRHDGRILDDDFPFISTDEIKYYYTGDFIFRYSGGTVEYKEWDDAGFAKIIDAGKNRVSDLYYYNGILSVNTTRFWEYTWANGKIIYNIATGDTLCIADPYNNQTLSFKFLETAETKYAKFYSDKITTAYYIISDFTQEAKVINDETKHFLQLHNSKMMRVDFATFEQREIYLFPETSVGYRFETGNEYFEESRVNILDSAGNKRYNFDTENEKVEKGKYEENIWDYRRTVYEDEKYEFFLTARKSIGIYLGGRSKTILNRYNKSTGKTHVIHHTDMWKDNNVGYNPDAIRYY